MSTPVYFPHAIALPSGPNITQVDSLPFNFNFDLFSIFSGSSATPGFTGSHGMDPILNVSTTQIKDILDTCDINEIARALDGNTDVEWRKSNSLTGREAAASLVHSRTRATKGLLTWESIEASQSALATIDVRLQFISDGTNAPLASANDVALGPAAAVQHGFTLGPATISTASLPAQQLCVKAMRWNNNIEHRNERCSGDGYVSYAAVDKFEPMVTIDVEDVSKPLALINSGGGGESITALTVYLRRKELGGINYSDASTEHIKFTATVGTAVPMGPRQLGIKLHSFTVQTGQAIT